MFVSSERRRFSQTFSESFKCSLANLRQAFLSRESLWVLQDFNLWLHSVLPVVYLGFVIPAAIRSLRSFSLGLIHRLFFPHPWGKILHGDSNWGRLMVILYSPFVNNCTFSPSLFLRRLQWKKLKIYVFYTRIKIKTSVIDCSQNYGWVVLSQIRTAANHYFSSRVFLWLIHLLIKGIR